MADFKPADLYVGVMEVFTIVLPGALLTGCLVLAVPVGPEAFSPLLDEAASQWAAFAIAAYGLGAIVFSIAAELDGLYDEHRRRHWPNRPGDAYDEATALRARYFGVPREQTPRVVKIATGWKKVLREAVRRLAWLPAPPAIGPGETQDTDSPMNTFTWAKTLLLARAPAAAADVQRYEAESKFFRSLLVVLPAMGLLAGGQWLFEMRWGLAAAAVLLPIALTPLCFRRYAEQRRKSTEWAYSYAISLQNAAPAEAAKTASSAGRRRPSVDRSNLPPRRR